MIIKNRAMKLIIFIKANYVNYKRKYMSLQEYFKEINLDFQNVAIYYDGGCEISGKTEISPNEFLGFAKNDFQFGNLHGLINAITNAKRAIDCQLDNVISSIGYDYTLFDNNKYRKKFHINKYIKGNEKKFIKTSLKLRFIRSLEIAPAELVAEIRALRNKIEHEYFVPSDIEALKAIELADLFIGSIQNKIRFIGEFFIGNYNREMQNIKGNKILISYSEEEFKYIISCNSNSFELDFESDLYLYLIRLNLSVFSRYDAEQAFKSLLMYLDYKLDSKEVKLHIV